VSALQARIESIESEILRLVNLASRADDTQVQERYWNLAKDLQTEARLIRAELRAQQASSERRWWNRFFLRRKD